MDSQPAVRGFPSGSMFRILRRTGSTRRSRQRIRMLQCDLLPGAHSGQLAGRRSA